MTDARLGAGRAGAILSRRATLGAALGFFAAPSLLRAEETPGVALECRDARLFWPGGSARAALGKGGVTRHKKEGDGATPAGTFGLSLGLYRSDRVTRPATALPMIPLREHHAWVDDPKDPQYNRLVETPYPAHVENLWRSDGIYDVLVVVDYNTNPTVAGAGSAIFLHIARPNFTPTVGCVAIERDALLHVLRMLGPRSTLTIRT